jgi:hypothetical protein
VLAAGLRRIGIAYGAVIVGTLAVSALLGLLAGDDVVRSMAIGLYVVGAVILVGCFVFGVRGPLRGESKSGETTGLIGAKRVRRATPDERSEAARTSILLFALGLGLIVIGSLIDPAHSTF